MQQKIFAVCCLFYFGICFSQHSISGKIYSTDSVPIASCHVHIGPKSVSSNSNGEYIIKNISTGLFKVSIYCIGYQSIDSTISVSENKQINFVLKQKVNQLNVVVVKHTINNYNKSVLEQKIKTETIEKYSNQSLGEALKEVTGVSILKTGSNIMKPIINGLHSSRVPIITNNIRLEDQQWEN